MAELKEMGLTWSKVQDRSVWKQIVSALCPTLSCSVRCGQCYSFPMSFSCVVTIVYTTAFRTVFCVEFFQSIFKGNPFTL